VSDAYFTVMGIGLVEGRTFDRRDDSGGAPVMVINEGLARDLFGGRSAVGERIGFVYLPDTWFEVVGVVEDVKLDGLDAAAPPVVYVSARQDPNVLASLVVRTTVDPVSVAGPVRNELLARQPLAAISNVASMRQIIDTSPAVVLRRYPAQVLTGFAVLALLLVAIGLYGVMRYSVTRRTREIGIRIALGASPAGIIARTVREGLRVAATGIAIGAAGALLLTRFLESVLFGVRAIDGLTMLGGALLVAATAAVATYLPSRRASRVDPAVALRHE
jgi:putative ABC transport system permease protein